MLTVPRLSPEDLEKFASDFLDGYHRTRSLPIPIEEIVDVKMGINIVQVPGLKRYHDIDAYLSRDCSTIYVDEVEYQRNSTRFRFSVAHEVAHILLHGFVIEKLTFETVDGWKKGRDGIPAATFGRMEYQANTVAGLILVPPPELAMVFEEIQGRVDGDLAPPERREALAQMLRGRFAVSAQTIIYRLEHDELV